MSARVSELDRLLRPAMGRLALQAAVKALWIGLLCGLCAAAVAVIVSFFTPLEYLTLMLAGLVVTGPLIGFLIGFIFLRPGRRRVARALDRLGGQERAVTLLELGGRDDAYVQLLKKDAEHMLPLVDVKAGIRMVQPRWVYIACAAAAFAILVSFAIPNIQRDILNARRETRQAIEKQAEKLENELDKKELDEAAKAELRKLAEALRQSQTMSDALKQLAKAEDSLKALAQRQANQAANQLAAAFNGAGSTKPLAEALKKQDQKAFEGLADELAKNLTEGKMSGADKAALSQALAQAAAGLSDQQLSDALSDAAGALGSLPDGQAAEALNAALKAAGAATGGKSGGAVNAEALLKAARAQLNASSQSLSNNQNGNGNGNGNGSGNGNGNGSGNGNGAGNGNGSGNGSGTGAGAGTGGGPDSENESANGYGNGGYNSQYAPGGERPQGTYEPVYAPDRLGGSDSGVTDGGSRNDDGQSDMTNLGPGQGSAGGYIPYDQVVYDYQAEAAQAMDRENIPAGMRQWVERYFSSITN